MPTKISSALETKDFITIAVAALMLTTGIVINKFENELIVFVLISFSFGLLSFLMIGKIEGKEISFLGIKISQVSGGFLIFIIVLASFLAYKKITNYADNKTLKLLADKKISELLSDKKTLEILSDKNVVEIFSDKRAVDLLMDKKAMETLLDKKTLEIFSDKKALEIALGNAINLARPIDDSVWADATGIFKWFNPPLSFAATDHLKLKEKWFNDANFQLEILLIQSNDSLENRDHFIPRLKNLKIFADSVKKQYKDFNMIERIKVRVCIEDYIPTQSFFFSKKWGNKDIRRSIFYLPSKENPSRPSRCIITPSLDFFDYLNDEFESHWNQDAQLISLQKLLDIKITNSTNRDSLVLR